MRPKFVLWEGPGSAGFATVSTVGIRSPVRLELVSGAGARNPAAVTGVLASRVVVFAIEIRSVWPILLLGGGELLVGIDQATGDLNLLGVKSSSSPAAEANSGATLGAESSYPGGRM